MLLHNFLDFNDEVLLPFHNLHFHSFGPLNLKTSPGRRTPQRLPANVKLLLYTNRLPTASTVKVRCMMAQKTNPITNLPSELVLLIFDLLDPDDAVQLYHAFHEHDKSVFDWIDITKRHRANMLSNKVFCNALEPDVRKSRDPDKLYPSARSGLPQDRTYADLLREAQHPAYSNIREEKKKDLEDLRLGLLFMTRDFRRGVDIPSEKVKQEMNLQRDSISYLHWIAMMPESANRLKHYRMDDERLRRTYQEDALRGIIMRMHAEPDFLPTTCRKCFVHTVKNDVYGTVQRRMLHGVVYCRPCNQDWCATGPVRKSCFLSPESNSV